MRPLLRCIRDARESVSVIALAVTALAACNDQIVIGRDVDAPKPDADPGRPGPRPPPPPLFWFSTCPAPGCFPIEPTPGGPAPLCPPEGAPCFEPMDRCGAPSPATCGAIMVCDETDPKERDCPRR